MSIILAFDCCRLTEITDLHNVLKVNVFGFPSSSLDSYATFFKYSVCLSVCLSVWSASSVTSAFVSQLHGLLSSFLGPIIFLWLQLASAVSKGCVRTVLRFPSSARSAVGLSFDAFSSSTHFLVTSADVCCRSRLCTQHFSRSLSLASAFSRKWMVS